jgi:dTDP-4-dehydrorhamnose reductase
VHDQKGCPTYAPDLAAVLLYLVHQGAAGYFHVTNRGACTWHDFAVEIARACGADPRRIQPCRTEDYPTPARRPACSILLSRRLETAGYPPRPTWQDALSRYLRTLDDSLAAPS